MSFKSDLIPEEKILNKILVLREERVMLDIHLADLYGVETRVLKQAVRRNEDRFPHDFKYELREEEIDFVVSQNVIPHKKYFGGAVPYAFTEAGVAMLSSVLRSEKALQINIAIMRTFVALRKNALNYEEIMDRINKMEREYGGKFSLIFNELNKLITPENTPRQKIGYRKNK